MPWVRFTKDFAWSPRQAVTIKHLAGHRYRVTTICMNAAIKAGAAEAEIVTEQPKPATRKRLRDYVGG